MGMPFDRNIFTQIGLDSGSLTIFGTITHSFQENGVYRCVLYREEAIESVFYIRVDKKSPVAHVNIDLARLSNGRIVFKQDRSDKRHTKCPFVIHPKGYALFHVSFGSGGFHILARIAEEESKQKTFDSRVLNKGDIFTAIIIRPGTYSVTNLLSKARGEIDVTYPTIGKTAYRPPNPIKVECKEDIFEPEKIQIKPGQGLIYNFLTPSRIKIELLKPTDDPKHKSETIKSGWKKPILPAREIKVEMNPGNETYQK